MREESLTPSEAGVLAHVLEEVEWLGFLDRTEWSREDFYAAEAKLMAIAGEYAPKSALEVYPDFLHPDFPGSKEKPMREERRGS